MFKKGDLVWVVAAHDDDTPPAIVTNILGNGKYEILQFEDKDIYSESWFDIVDEDELMVYGE